MPKSREPRGYSHGVARPARQGIFLGIAAVAALVRCGKLAERRYRVILAEQAEHAGALAGLGRLLCRQERWAEAVEVWERASAADPETTEPIYQLARALARNGCNARAAVTYLNLLEQAPAHPHGLTGLELSLERLLHSRPGSDDQELRETAWTRAEILLGAKLAQDPGSARWRANLARVREANERHDEALALWAGLANEAPGSLPPLFEIARIKQQRAYPDAATALRTVLKLNPRHRQALRRMVRLLTRTRATDDDALATWREISALDPRSSFPLVQIALVMERTGPDGAAETAHRDALAAAPGDPLVLVSAARFYRRLGRWAEAKSLFERLHRAEPKRIDALLGVGRCDEQLGDIAAAEAAYQRALQIDRRNVAASVQLARLLRRRGRIEEAIEVQRAATALTPASAAAWHELVYLLATVEHEADALEELDRAETSLGASAAAAIELGRIAEDAQFFDRAEEYFARAIKTEPENADHRAQLGEYYLRQGIVDAGFRKLLDSREIEPRNIPVAARLVDTAHLLQMLDLDPVAVGKSEPSTEGILVPESLFRLVRRIAETEILPYEPVERRVIAVSASLAPGGAERQLMTLLRGISAPDFAIDASLLCVALGPLMRRDFFLPPLVEAGIAVTASDPAALGACLSDPAVAPHADLLRRFPEEMVAPAAFWMREFVRCRPAVVHAWQDSTNLTAVVAALLAGVPRIVLSARSVRPDNPRRRLKRFMREAYQAVLGHHSVVLCNNSQSGAADYADWLGIAPEEIEVAHNGIDTDTLDQGLDPAETIRLKSSLGIAPEAPVLGGVFRMSEEKRPLLWVDAAAAVARQVPSAHFVVCGEGPMRDDMVARAAAVGIGDRLHLPGAQGRIAAWYGLMDVVMLASRHEGLPNVLLEAQHLGIPVVAPAVGGVPETIRNGMTGWAVDSADPERLAERVCFCLADPAWRAQARVAGPEFVRSRFSVRAMLDRYLDIYQIAQPDARR